jgi:phage shock protein A
VGYQLRMSGEIHDWLEQLGTADPARARLVAEALAALAAGGASLGLPLVRPADPDHPGSAETELDPRAQLDQAYQDQLEQLAALRRRVAEAATLARQFSTQLGDLGSLRVRLAEQREEASAAGDASRAETVQQAIVDVDRQVATLRERLPQVTSAEQALARQSYQRQVRSEELRIRKETLKARYTAAEGECMVARATAALDADLNGEPDPDGEPDPERGAAQPGTTAAAAQAKLQAIAAQIENELRQPGQPASVAGLPALLELRPGVPAQDDASGAETSILFVVEPPGTARLIAVLDGGEAIREHHGEAVSAARDVLRQARSSQDAEPAGHSYPDAAAVLAAFGSA